MPVNFCPRCGKPQDPSNVFCPQCGLALAPTGTVEQPPPPHEADQPVNRPTDPFPPELLQQLRFEEQTLSRRSRRTAQIGCLVVLALLVLVAVFLVGFGDV